MRMLLPVVVVVELLIQRHPAVFAGDYKGACVYVRVYMVFLCVYFF